MKLCMKCGKINEDYSKISFACGAVLKDKTKKQEKQRKNKSITLF